MTPQYNVLEYAIFDTMELFELSDSFPLDAGVQARDGPAGEGGWK